ncbi:MAG: NeuD/PglB/VioB family sugar acetyltransferase [Actinomycetota bacterium]|nr:NeuD/PglB/VioB family sugar acetyltransferase [Actinomycetota bacterium]
MADTGEHGSSDRRVLVVGAGGHARVCLEALADSGHVVVGCVSKDGIGAVGLPVPVVGRTDDLVSVAAAVGATHSFVAVGDNAIRQRLTEACVAAGLPPVNAISRFAMISPGASLGAGVAVLAGAVVNAAAVVGDGAVLNTRCSVDHDCVIGACAHVSVGVALGGGVSVGDRALVGIGATVLPLRSVGADAVVCGGSVVVHDVPAGARVVGAPARPMPTVRHGAA